MKKAIFMLIMLMGILGIALITYQGEDNAYLIIYNTISIMIVFSMQSIKNIFKFNYRLITFLQLICTIVLVYFGIHGTTLMIPILIFELLHEKISLVYTIIINTCIAALFIKSNLDFVLIYIIIINLYLYELKKHEKIRNELMSANRATREDIFDMEKKIVNLNKYLQQNDVMTTLRERNYMAQKLHDSLGHRITSSLMQLEVTKETLEKDVSLSRKYLVSAMDNLRQGMDEIRQLLRNVKPRDKVIGIEDIKEILLKFQYSTGINTSLKVEGDIDRIRTSQFVAIETNIKEALTNASKYSKATQVQVSFYIYNKFARIEIRDNGVGCKSINRGIGIKGMEERLESMNGSLKFDNENGFVIKMILNLGD